MFYVLITYDVNTSSETGQKRLRHVAKCCKNYGQRVQNSVFECFVDLVHLTSLRARLLELIDPDLDSIRIYHLGKNYDVKVEQYGKSDSYSVDGSLII